MPLAGRPASTYIQCNKKWRKLLSTKSKIAQAEARFKSPQKERDDRQNARNQYDADQDAIRQKTERLRALRLAREATEASGTEPNRSAIKSGSRKKTPATC